MPKNQASAKKQANRSASKAEEDKSVDVSMSEPALKNAKAGKAAGANAQS